MHMRSPALGRAPQDPAPMPEASPGVEVEGFWDCTDNIFTCMPASILCDLYSPSMVNSMNVPKNLKYLVATLVFEIDTPQSKG